MKIELAYRRDIQALRGIAVLSVILYHAEENIFPMGFLGVDVFFVISGFVVTPLIMRIFEQSKNEFQWWSNAKVFYRRRLYRLAPALIVTLLASVIVIFCFGPVNDHKKVANQGIATILLAGNVSAYRNFGDYFSPNLNPFIHTWSLSVEEQIYLILPLILYAVFRKHNFSAKKLLRTFVFFSAISFLMTVIISEFQSIHTAFGIKSASDFSFYSPLNRFWQFGIGGILYLNTNLKQANDTLVTAKWKSIIKISLLVLVFLPLQYNPKLSSIAISLFTVSLIVEKDLLIIPRKIDNWVSWLGNRSYSLYLVHMPIIYVAKYSEWADLGTHGDRRLQTFSAVILTFILGNLMYLYVEEPFRLDKSGRSKVELHLNRIVASLMATLLIFVAVYVNSYSQNDLDPNFPVDKEASHFSTDYDCRTMQLTPSINFLPCVYPVLFPTKNLLLIGDSHARHLIQTMIEIGENSHSNVFIQTRSACPFILNQKLLNLKFTFPKLTIDCIEHNMRIKEFVSKNQIDVVIYTQRSVVGYAVPPDKINTKHLIHEVGDSLGVLKQSVSRVIFIGITPEYSSINSVASKVIGRKGYFLESLSSENQIWKHVLLKEAVEYIDIYPLFCNKSKECKNRIGSTWLFVDGDHLSKAGGNLIKPLLEKSLAT